MGWRWGIFRWDGVGMGNFLREWDGENLMGMETI